MRTPSFFRGQLVAVLGSLLWLGAACAPTGGNDRDAGVTDGGTNVEPSTDAGPSSDKLAEGETCSVAAPNCDEGMLCLPNALNPALGTCRVDCGLRNDQGEIINEDATKCSANRACLVVQDPGTFDLVAVACLPQVSTRDATCLAPGDEDACAAPMACHIGYVQDQEDPEDAPTSFNCKLTCDPEADDANDGCPGDESCFRSNLIQGFEIDSTGQNILVCDLATCEAGTEGCECNSAEGYECIQLNSSAEGKGGCVYVPGECGIGQRGLTIDDLNAGAGIPADTLCDAVADHTYCDNSRFDGLEEPGANICVYQGVFADNGDPYAGFCFEYCSTPTVDLDGNGTIDTANADGDDENGVAYACPAGKGCYTDLGLELLLGPAVPGDGLFGVKSCSLTTCTAGQPCGECGPGEAQCVSYDADGPGPQAAVGLCIAPVGNCEPLRAEPTTDAGTPDVDAGTESDAGVDIDAGVDTDAGVDADAGVTDAG